MVYTVLMILIVVASLLMVGVVLIQKSKGGGLAENFAKGNDFAGVKQTTDLVEKVTWGIMGFIAVCCIVCTKFSEHKADAAPKSEIETTTAAPTLPMAQPNVEGAAAPAAEAPVAAPAEAPAN